MKKFLIFTTLFLMSAGSLTAFSFYSTPKTESGDCQYGRCQKIKADGYQCRNCAQEGSIYCWSHQPRY